MICTAVGLVTALVLAQATPAAPRSSNSSPRVWKSVTFTPAAPHLQAPGEPRPCLKMRIVRGHGSTDPNMPVLRGSNAVDPKFNVGEDLAPGDQKDAR